MSVLVLRKGRRARYKVDRRWPDGKRFIRAMPTRSVAEEVDARIAAAVATGAWREYRRQLARGLTAKRITLAEAFERYIELHCKVKNRAWQRKRDTMRAVL